MLLLQAAELTKATAAAAAGVGQHAQDNAFQSLLWFLVLAELAVACIAVVLWYRAITTRNEAIRQAVDKATTDANNRLEKINQDLRLQDKKSVEVIGAVANAINNNTATVQALQYQFVTIETLLTGRGSQPPIRPHAPFTPPQP